MKEQLKTMNEEDSKPCCVYFMAGTGYCEGCYFKIGISDDPKRRLKQIQTSTPFEIKVCSRWRLKSRCKAAELEGILHRVFRDHHSKGEWFYLDDLNDLQKAADLFTDICSLSSDDFKQYNLA